jgi:hypothetical protein
MAEFNIRSDAFKATEVEVFSDCQPCKSVKYYRRFRNTDPGAEDRGSP